MSQSESRGPLQGSASVSVAGILLFVNICRLRGRHNQGGADMPISPKRIIEIPDQEQHERDRPRQRGGHGSDRPELLGTEQIH